MPEMVILCGYSTQFSELVEVVKTTPARLYYKASWGRDTYCDIGKVAVRNATPEMFQKLLSMEGQHDAKRREVVQQMKEQFAERARKVIEAEGGVYGSEADHAG